MNTSMWFFPVLEEIDFEFYLEEICNSNKIWFVKEKQWGGTWLLCHLYKYTINANNLKKSYCGAIDKERSKVE